MKITHHFKEKEQLQILEVYNLLHEIENKQILQEAIARIEKGFTNFVVDFSSMPYMNSVGLSFLINLMKKVNESNGKLVLVHVNRAIERLLVMTKVRPMFTIKTDLKQGLETMTNN